ncbi:FecR family protein [Sphingobacterium bambusae]|uniref:FecR family protein n=1 Tax=Sphingobacterium bambusae TaxID=662858 RepID=A0ABW6BAE2_9SPHI|nr:FecR domain-containing protein [Sphingobacterium bambusae]WPL48638.1 DUF4974 domain-containing protein [Sphingobacterium bambusae]
MPDHLDTLLTKYLNGSCTEEEQQLVDLWLIKRGHDRGTSIDTAREEQVKALVFAQLQQLIHADNSFERPGAGSQKGIPAIKRRKFVRAIAAAAVILAIFSAGIFYLNEWHDTQRTALVEGSFANRAVHERPLGYQINVQGKSYNIDSLPINEEIEIAGAILQKKSSNILSYKPLKQLKDQTNNSYHSVSVPSGKDLHLYLPDGSKVWINTESTLHFPTVTTEKRQLYLSGEAFFEVASDKEHPFIVESRDFAVRATGTQFNVRAYADEDVQSTTLVEGKVDIRSDRSLKKLSPNQQWQMKAGQEGSIKPVDVSCVLGNRDGYFVFQNNDLKHIMSEVARWYAIDVNYVGEIKNKEFGGTFSKKRSLDELLDYLRDLGGYHIIREGRRVSIMP